MLEECQDVHSGIVSACVEDGLQEHLRDAFSIFQDEYEAVEALNSEPDEGYETPEGESAQASEPLAKKPADALPDERQPQAVDVDVHSSDADANALEENKENAEAPAFTPAESPHVHSSDADASALEKNEDNVEAPTFASAEAPQGGLLQEVCASNRVEAVRSSDTAVTINVWLEKVLGAAMSRVLNKETCASAPIEPSDKHVDDHAEVHAVSLPDAPAQTSVAKEIIEPERVLVEKPVAKASDSSDVRNTPSQQASSGDGHRLPVAQNSACMTSRAAELHEPPDAILAGAVSENPSQLVVASPKGPPPKRSRPHHVEGTTSSRQAAQNPNVSESSASFTSPQIGPAVQLKAARRKLPRAGQHPPSSENSTSSASFASAESASTAPPVTTAKIQSSPILPALPAARSSASSVARKDGRKSDGRAKGVQQASTGRLKSSRSRSPSPETLLHLDMYMAEVNTVFSWKSRVRSPRRKAHPKPETDAKLQQVLPKLANEDELDAWRRRVVDSAILFARTCDIPHGALPRSGAIALA